MAAMAVTLKTEWERVFPKGKESFLYRCSPCSYKVKIIYGDHKQLQSLNKWKFSQTKENEKYPRKLARLETQKEYRKVVTYSFLSCAMLTFEDAPFMMTLYSETAPVNEMFREINWLSVVEIAW